MVRRIIEAATYDAVPAAAKRGGEGRVPRPRLATRAGRAAEEGLPRPAHPRTPTAPTGAPELPVPAEKGAQVKGQIPRRGSKENRQEDAITEFLTTRKPVPSLSEEEVIPSETV